MDNVTFLNSLAKTMSAEYQERIPTATQANLSTIATIISDYPTTKNEFISALTNKVIKSKIYNRVYENRFKFLKKGQLPFGTSVELIVANIVEGKNFTENFGESDSTIGSLLSVEKPSVEVQYIERNIQLKYKLTISDLQLMGAFTSENGLSNLVNALVTSVVNSMELDEELLINKAINSISDVQATINNYDSLTDSEKAATLTKTIMVTIDKMQFLSQNFNKKEHYTFSKPSDLIIFVTPETKANLNVDLLANTYNLEKAEINAKIVIVKEFTDSNVVAKIIDKECIQFYDSYNTSGQFNNADRMENHTFYHTGKILGVCPYFNHVDVIKATS